MELDGRLRYAGVEIEFDFLAPTAGVLIAIPAGNAFMFRFLVFLRKGTGKAHVLLLLFEARHADTEGVEVIAELVREVVDDLLVGRAGLRHMRAGIRDNLCHLVARDRLVALERVIAIAREDAVFGELRDRLISPMVARDILEQVIS